MLTKPGIVLIALSIALLAVTFFTLFKPARASQVRIFSGPMLDMKRLKGCIQATREETRQWPTSINDIRPALLRRPPGFEASIDLQQITADGKFATYILTINRKSSRVVVDGRYL